MYSRLGRAEHCYTPLVDTFASAFEQPHLSAKRKAQSAKRKTHGVKRTALFVNGRSAAGQPLCALRFALKRFTAPQGRRIAGRSPPQCCSSEPKPAPCC